MKNLELELTEGLPVIKRSGNERSNKMIVLIDEIPPIEHIKIPKEVQNELRFIGLKGLTDFVSNL